MMLRTHTTAAMALLVATSMVSAQTVNLGTLADELADRDNLAIHPDGRYTQHQASSHDPRNALGQSALGAPWGFMNVDFGNYLRQETNQGRQEFVVMEDSGPGVVTRWWSTGINSALLNNNRFRVYIDGAASPTITATASSLVGGNNHGFGGSLNFATPNLGGNLYGPIAYKSGLKITWDGPTTHGTHSVADRNPNLNHSTSNALWYNINYRKLAPGAHVNSYTTSDTNTYQSKLNTVNNRLANPSTTGSVTHNHSVNNHNLVSGQSLTHSLNGTGAVRRLKLNVSGANNATALKDAVVELSFDGQMTARVSAGQFFANGVSKNSANHLNEGGNYMQKVAANGDMTSYFVMPYEKDAEIKIINNGAQAINVDLEVDFGNWTWDENSMHFHANHRREDNIRTQDVGGWPGSPAAGTGYSAPGAADYRFLSVRGKGVYVGDVLSVNNHSIGGSQWWGEGDEKVYVDYLNANGDGSTANPNHVGTGTEDYYGYSFGSGSLFASPFVGQPISDGQSQGGPTVNSRVRGLDAIPFDQSFKFDLEVWKWASGDVDFDSAVFWYGRPGAVALVTAADLASDFRAGVQNGDAANNIADTTGDGQWTYISSDNANPNSAGAATAALTWGDVGDAGNKGYGGGQNGHNLAAISDQFLFVDGGDNLGVQGEPGYHELALHPGGNVADGPFADDAVQPYVVARWIAGESSAGLININGSVRNFIDTGDSVDFHIYVNGLLAFQKNASGTALPETYFDFDALIEAGQFVDFVLGNNGAGNLFGDESLLRAIILTPDVDALTVPEPASAMLMMGAGGLLALKRR